jgi:energy-coupling factor transport system substrate-specific component
MWQRRKMMNTNSTQEQKKGLKGWSTRDLMVTAVIAMAFSVILLGMNYLSGILMAINPAFVSILSGFYFTPVVAAMYIVRRPGTAVLAAVIGSLALMLFNPAGWMGLLFSAVFGAAAELPFLLTRYRDFRLRILLIAGASGSLISFALMFVFGAFNMPPMVQIVTFFLFLISGALLGGWLAKALADAVAKTGVLYSFPIAAEQQEEI